MCIVVRLLRGRVQRLELFQTEPDLYPGYIAFLSCMYAIWQ